MRDMNNDDARLVWTGFLLPLESGLDIDSLDC